MEISPLPQLRTLLGKEVPSAIAEQLSYLWSACAVGLERSPSVLSSSSHRLSQAFVNTARLHKVDLPPQITDKLCGMCSVLLVPSITCHVRIRERTRMSRVNRGKPERLRNEVVVRCMLCQHVSKAPGYLRKRKDNSSKINAVASSTTTPAAAASASAAPTTNSASQSFKGKFSFLNRLKPADSKPTSGSATSTDNQRRTSAPGKLPTTDFLSFAPTPGTSVSHLSQANNKNLQALCRGIINPRHPSPTVSAGSAVSAGGTVNLLELEALNKKKRRKTLGPSS